MDLYQPCILLDHPDFVACYKPPGRETISETGDPDLLSAVRELIGEPGLRPVHRLDRDTSGLQLFARHTVAEEGLTGLFRQRRIDKVYLAVCLGVPGNRTGCINRRLSSWQGGRRPIRVIKGGGGLEASTDYKVVAASDQWHDGKKLSLVEYGPRQGRTHQIRVHAAAFGYPILGDDQYGDRLANRQAANDFSLQRQALHSRHLEFLWNGEKVAISCPLPEDLANLAARAFPRARIDV